MDKKGEKNEKKFRLSRKNSSDLETALAKACEGLIYISETDSPVTVYAGPKLSELSVSTISPHITKSDQQIEEAAFKAFFSRLTTPKEWHGDRERKRAKKFLDLQKLIEENLMEPHVFRVGRIRVRIYVVGLDSDGRVVGVEMDATET